MTGKGKITAAAVAAVLLLISAAVYFSVKTVECENISDRQRRLNMIKEDVVILYEAEVEGHMISAVKYKGNKNGLAVFQPLENGKHKFQSAYWRDEKEIATAFVIAAGQRHYLACSLIRDDLDRAEITYSYDGKTERVEADMQPGQMIVCLPEPQTDSYTVDVAFYDTNGNKYE